VQLANDALLVIYVKNPTLKNIGKILIIEKKENKIKKAKGNG
jgi:hypothetical protein